MTAYGFGTWLRAVFGDDQKAAELIADPEMVMQRAGLNEGQVAYMRTVLSKVPPQIKAQAEALQRLGTSGQDKTNERPEE